MRKTKEEAELTRQALLKGALKCFDKKGIGGSTINDIAAAAGVTKGALYWHFDGKGALLRELRSAVALPILDRADMALLHEGDADPLERLECFIAAMLESLETDKAVRQSLGVMHFKCEYVGELERELDGARVNTGKLIVAFGKAYVEARRRGLLIEGVTPKTAAAETMMFFAGLLRMWLLQPAIRGDARAAIAAHVSSKRARK